MTARDRDPLSRPGEASIADLAAALHADDPAVREGAAEELHDRYRLYDDGVVIAGLVAAARADGPTADGAVDLLTELRDDRAIPGLLALVEDPDPETRAAAARALGPVPGGAVDDALLDCVADSDPAVRERAVRALKRRGHERAPEVFLDALDDPARRVVEAGIDGLVGYRDEQWARDAIESVATDSSRSPALRNVAARMHPDDEVVPDASRIPVVGPRFRRWLARSR